MTILTNRIVKGECYWDTDDYKFKNKIQTKSNKGIQSKRKRDRF